MVSLNEMASEDRLSEGVAALKSGNKSKAQRLLMDVAQKSPQDVEAWLWLGAAVSTPGETLFCLERVLQLAPGNQKALSGIKWAKSQAEGREIKAVDPFLVAENAQLAGTSSSETDRVDEVAPATGAASLKHQNAPDVLVSQADVAPSAGSSPGFFSNLIIAALAVVLLMGVLIIVALLRAWLG